LIQPDVIALDEAAAVARAVEPDAVIGVAGNDVALAVIRPADRGGRGRAERRGAEPRAVADVEATESVAQRGGAVRIDADEVPLDDVAPGVDAVDGHAALGVAGDHVAGAARGGGL